MQEQALYWTREAAKERGEMPATRPSGPYFDAYLGSPTGLTLLGNFCGCSCLYLLGEETEEKVRVTVKKQEKEDDPPVLATCGIRPPDEAFEDTQSRLLLLADSEEEE